MAFSALVGGLVGSRVDFLIENWSDVKHDLLGSIFSGSGLVWYGGAIGGALAVFAWARYRHFLSLALLDLAAPALALGYAIGRIGCQFSGDGDYGKPFSGLTAMSYPNGTKPTTQTVYPTPVYETLAMGLIALALWNLRDRFRPGVLFAVYLFLAGLERFLVEFIRRNSDVALGLTQAQLISVAMMLIGGIWVVVTARSEASPARRRPAERPRLDPRDSGHAEDQRKPGHGQTDASPGGVLVSLGQQVGGAEEDEEAGVKREHVAERVLGDRDEGSDDHAARGASASTVSQRLA